MTKLDLKVRTKVGGSIEQPSIDPPGTRRLVSPFAGLPVDETLYVTLHGPQVKRSAELLSDIRKAASAYMRAREKVDELLKAVIEHDETSGLAGYVRKRNMLDAAFKKEAEAEGELEAIEAAHQNELATFLEINEG